MVKLAGSTPIPLAGARSLGAVAPDERFDITVRVRRKKPLAPAAYTDGLGQRKYLSRAEYAATHGADDADLQKVADFARQAGLVVVDSDSARRSVFLSGTAQQISAAFGTSLEQVEHDNGVSRHPTTPLNVPPELADIIEGVFGLSDAPVAKPHFLIGEQVDEIMAAAATRAFTPVDLAKLYDFPPDLDGTGQCIAIIELGGGYRASDLKKYFGSLRLPVPKVSTVSIDGGKNHPTVPTSADGEVMLDIEVAGAIAPKAEIVVYFAPNTDKGFLDAITAAIHDERNKPAVISISWGAPEKEWSEQAMASFDSAFQAAAALGVTICCAAGDAGSGDENPDRGTADGLAHADFPGSSPHVLCCGGTRLTANGKVITAETVWNDDPQRSASGGGISDFFPLPTWQSSAIVPPSANPGGHVGRGLPDVAGNADPETGYRIRVDGLTFVFGGTSAVAPLWAGLIALINQQLKQPVGYLNPLLYGPVVGSGALRDITVGNIGAYQAKPGWDACTGWGSPVGASLLQTLAH
jgi:kumamolisin